MMQDVYLIISNYETRSKVHAVCTKEQAIVHFNLMCKFKPEHWIKENCSSTHNVKYYELDEYDNKVFKEHLYIEKRTILGS